MESREFQKSALYVWWGITGRESEHPPCDVKTPLNISYDYDLLTRMKLSAWPDLVLRCDSFMSNRKNKQLAWLFLHLFSDCFVKCVRRNPGPEHQRAGRVTEEGEVAGTIPTPSIQQQGLETTFTQARIAAAANIVHHIRFRKGRKCSFEQLILRPQVTLLSVKTFFLNNLERISAF